MNLADWAEVGGGMKWGVDDHFARWIAIKKLLLTVLFA